MLPSRPAWRALLCLLPLLSQAVQGGVGFRGQIAVGDHVVGRVLHLLGHGSGLGGVQVAVFGMFERLHRA